MTKSSSLQSETPQPNSNSEPSVVVRIDERNGLAERPIDVLLVEDRDDHAALVSALLEAGLGDAELTIEHVETSAEGIMRLQARTYDVCLLDFHLGETDNGLQVLEAVNARELSTPIILMTAVGDEGVAVSAMKAGAKDYLRKEALSPELLRSAIWHALELHREEELRKQTQLELQQAKEELEAKVAELDAANKHLVKLDRLKDEFVSTISHELRTPITNLKLGHHLLLANPDERNKYLATLRRETERLHFIIEELLLVARMAQQPPEARFSKIDLNALALLYVADRTLLAEERGLTLTYQGESDLLKVRADRMQMERVLGILLLNSLNYTPQGGEVTVRTGSMHTGDNGSSEDVWVGFTVEDNGPGISAEEQERLYERFYRGSAALESGVPGTGLGLSIAKEIIDTHGGQIDLVSEGVPGKGTRVHVWLPALS